MEDKTQENMEPMRPDGRVCEWCEVRNALKDDVLCLRCWGAKTVGMSKEEAMAWFAIDPLQRALPDDMLTNIPTDILGALRAAEFQVILALESVQRLIARVEEERSSRVRNEHE